MTSMMSPDVPGIETQIAQIQAKVAQSDYLSAAPLCARALERAPSDARLLALGGDCAFMLWDNEAAARRYRQLSALRPDDIEVLLKLGETQERLKRFADAKAIAKKIIALDAGNGPARLLLGRCWASTGQWREAIENIAGDEAYRSAASLSARVRAHVELGEQGEAIEVVRKISTRPRVGGDVIDTPLAAQIAQLALDAAAEGRFDVVRELADVLSVLGDHERAETLFQFLLDAAQPDVQNELSFARFLNRTQRAEGAIARLRTVGARAELEAGDWKLLACAFAECGAVVDAVHVMERSEQDESRFAESLLTLATDLRSKGHEKWAVALLSTAVSQHAHSAPIDKAFDLFVFSNVSEAAIIARLNFMQDVANLCDLARRYRAQKKWYAAQQICKRILTLDPRHAQAKSDLENASAILGVQSANRARESWHLSAARAQVSNLRELFGQSFADIAHCSGEIHYELGEFEKAVRDHAAGVALTPSERGDRLLREARLRLATSWSAGEPVDAEDLEADTVHRESVELMDAIAAGRVELSSLPLIRHPAAEKFGSLLPNPDESLFLTAFELAQSGRQVDAIAMLFTCLNDSTQSVSTRLVLMPEQEYRLVEFHHPQPDPRRNWKTLCDIALRLSTSPFQQAAMAALEPASRMTSALESPSKEGCPYSMRPAWANWRSAVADREPGSIVPRQPGSVRIAKDARIAMAGSCFAQNIARYLPRWGYAPLLTEPGPTHLEAGERKRRGYGIYPARFGNIYTSLQVLQLFDRAYGLFHPVEDVWRDPDGLRDPFRPQLAPCFQTLDGFHADRAMHFAAVREMFEKLDVFIFTLGLTEAWVSSVDGAVFPICPGCGGGTFDPAKHRFVNFRVADVVAHVSAFFDRLAQVNPRAKVLLTVSPVPLIATMEERHVLTSTVCSKSILPAAADELSRNHPHVEYFPAYEIITSTFQTHRYFASDRRNVTEQGVQHVMKVFASTHLAEGEHEFAAGSDTIPAEREFGRKQTPLLSEDVQAVFCEEEQAYGEQSSDLDILTRADVEFYLNDDIHLFQSARTTGNEPLPITRRELAALERSAARHLIVEPGSLSLADVSLEPATNASPFPHLILPESWRTNIAERARCSLLALDSAITKAGVQSYMILQPISTRRLESDYARRARDLHAASPTFSSKDFAAWRRERTILLHTGEYRNNIQEPATTPENIASGYDLDDLYDRLRDLWQSGPFAHRQGCVDIMDMRLESQTSTSAHSLFTQDAVHNASEGSRHLGRLIAQLQHGADLGGVRRDAIAAA